MMGVWLFKGVFLLGLLMGLTGCHEQVARVGEAAPDLAVTDLNGEVLELNAWQGHYTYLSFWSSACGACIAELALIEPLSAQYAGRVQVVAVNVDPEDMPLKNLGRLTDVYVVLRDSLGISKERYRVDVTPTTYIIDDRGIVRQRLTGMHTPQALEALFAGMANGKV